MNAGSLQGEILPHRQNRDSRKPPVRDGVYRRLVVEAICAVLVVCCAPQLTWAQSKPTASRLGDLQLGGGFVFAKSSYNFTPINLIGGTAYTTFDMRTHWGGEFDFHQIRSTSDSTVYERTYEVGPRIFLTRGPLVPYAKLLVGRGVYNFHNSIANVAYNIYTYGGGADLKVMRSINVRADYELQNWIGFPLGTLHPSVVTIGVAYHFHE